MAPEKRCRTQQSKTKFSTKMERTTSKEEDVTEANWLGTQRKKKPHPSFPPLTQGVYTCRHMDRPTGLEGVLLLIWLRILSRTVLTHERIWSRVWVMEPASQLRERTARFRGVPVERGGSRACVSIYGKSVEESDIGVPSGVWREVSSIKRKWSRKHVCNSHWIITKS